MTKKHKAPLKPTLDERLELKIYQDALSWFKVEKGSGPKLAFIFILFTLIFEFCYRDDSIELDNAEYYSLKNINTLITSFLFSIITFGTLGLSVNELITYLTPENLKFSLLNSENRFKEQNALTLNHLNKHLTKKDCVKNAKMLEKLCTAYTKQLSGLSDTLTIMGASTLGAFGMELMNNNEHLLRSIKPSGLTLFSSIFVELLVYYLHKKYHAMTFNSKKIEKIKDHLKQQRYFQSGYFQSIKYIPNLNFGYRALMGVLHLKHLTYFFSIEINPKYFKKHVTQLNRHIGVACIDAMEKLDYKILLGNDQKLLFHSNYKSSVSLKKFEKVFNTLEDNLNMLSKSQINYTKIINELNKTFPQKFSRACQLGISFKSTTPTFFILLIMSFSYRDSLKEIIEEMLKYCPFAFSVLPTKKLLSLIQMAKLKKILPYIFFQNLEKPQKSNQ